MTASDPSVDGDPIERLLAPVLDLPEPDQRAAVASLCAAHASLASGLRDRFDRYRELLHALPPTRLDAGRQFGEFELQRELGRGGMGVVYLAQQRRAGQERLVALKLVHDQGLLSDRARERLRREAAAAFRLDDPGLCPVLDVGETDGVPWLAMRYVPGRTLARHIADARERGTFDVPAPATAGDPPSTTTATSTTQQHRIAAVLAIGEALARSLHTAHEAGFVHRDVKPGNIMITPDGKPVLLDFGLVRDQGSDHSLTVTGETLGTPAYMAPEQIDGRAPVDRTTDVYALGATLWEAITLQRPFDGRTREELFAAILQQDPAALRAGGTLLPRDVRIVLTTAMAREGRRRYATAREFALELGRLRRHEPILTRPPGPARRLWLWSQRNPLAAALLATLLLAIGGVTATALEAQRTAGLAQAAEARAVANLGAARRVVAELIRVQEQELDDVPGLEGLRRDMQERALGFLREFRPGADNQKQLAVQNADALLFAATLELSLGRPDPAQTLHREAERVLSGLPSVPATAALRARWHLFRSELLRRGADLPAALAALAAAVQELEAAPASDAESLQAMQLLFRTGILLERTNDRRTAMATVERALALQQGLQEPTSPAAVIAVAQLTRLRAELHDADNRLDEAARDFSAAATQLRTVLAAAPQHRQAMSALASCRQLEARLHRGADDRDKRSAALQEARELFERLATRFPGMPTYRNGLAATLSSLASSLDVEGRPDDAQAVLQRACELYRALIEEQPGNTHYAHGLAVALFNLGNRQHDERSKAVALYEEAQRHLDALLAKHPDEAQWQQLGARTAMNLAIAHARGGDARAAEGFARARAHAEHVLRLRPDDRQSRQLRDSLLFNEGAVRTENGDLPGAAPLLGQAFELAIGTLGLTPDNRQRAAEALKYGVRWAQVVELHTPAAAGEAWDRVAHYWQQLPERLQRALDGDRTAGFDRCMLQRALVAPGARRGEAPAHRELAAVGQRLATWNRGEHASAASRAEQLLCLTDLAAAAGLASDDAAVDAARTTAVALLLAWPPTAAPDQTMRQRLLARRGELQALVAASAPAGEALERVGAR